MSGPRARALAVVFSVVLVLVIVLVVQHLVHAHPPHGDNNGGGAGTRSVPVYFITNTPVGARLTRQQVTITTDAPLQQAVGAAMSLPAAPRFRSALRDPAIFTVAQRRGVVVLTLHPANVLTPSAGVSTRLALQAFVYTVQAALGRALPVRFVVGRAFQGRFGPMTQPVAAAPPEQVLAPLIVDSPADGTLVGSPFTVHGLATSAQGRVDWTLRHFGRLVAQGAATTAGGTSAAFAFTVSARPGAYVLTTSTPSPGTLPPFSVSLNVFVRH